ncbi:MAG: glycosyltransferase family 2 protein [Pirellulaceae bacterium]|nr:glycosyltransferase family 2 protein [Pirellulaceae bacterium]
MSPDVSIVIPYYNGHATIGRAVASALSQESVSTEVIIVDDGSADPVPREGLGDGRVRVIRTTNGGVAAARNVGLAASCGEFVQFLDQDDELYPHKCRVQIDYARRFKDSLTICDADLINEKTGRVAGWTAGYVSTADPVVHVATVTAQTSAALHRRETLLRLGGFRIDAPPCEDRDLHLRYAIGAIALVHVPIKLYRIHRLSGSQSDSRVDLCIEREEQLLRWAAAELSRSSGWTDQRREAFSGWAARLARRWLTRRRRGDAMRCFELGGSLHPSGGLAVAYSPRAMVIRKLFGPVTCEQFAGFSRWLLGRGPIA